MLANYRCNEIKVQTLEKFQDKINDFSATSFNKLMKNFKEICKELIEKILCTKINKNIATYDESASYYLEKIYQEVRASLINYLSQTFYVCFNNQTSRYMPIIQKNFKKDLESELKKSKNIKLKKDDNFINVATQKKKQYLLILKNHLDEFKVFENWIINIEMYEEAFDELIDQLKKLNLEKIKGDKTVSILYF